MKNRNSILIMTAMVAIVPESISGNISTRAFVNPYGYKEYTTNPIPQIRTEEDDAIALSKAEEKRKRRAARNLDKRVPNATLTSPPGAKL
jgi:hypothetical protein